MPIISQAEAMSRLDKLKHYQSTKYPNSKMDPTTHNNDLTGVNIAFIEMAFITRPELVIAAHVFSINPVFVHVTNKLNDLSKSETTDDSFDVNAIGDTYFNELKAFHSEATEDELRMLVSQGLVELLAFFELFRGEA